MPAQEELDPFDPRLPHHLTPYVLTVVITEPLKKVRDNDATELVVTVVPLVYDDPDPQKPDILAKEGTLEFERLALITYD